MRNEEIKKLKIGDLVIRTKDLNGHKIGEIAIFLEKSCISYAWKIFSKNKISLWDEENFEKL